jgi:hypothetical protein
LEENDPFFALLMPAFNKFMLIQKCMNITMTVRLGINQELILLECKMSAVVDHGWDLFLFHDGDLVFIHTKVIIFLKQLYSLSMGIIGSHDGKWNLDCLVTELVLIGQDIVAIVVHESFPGQKFKGNGHLDTWIAEPLAQTTGD